MMSTVYIHGIKKGLSNKELERVIKNTFLKATNNLEWLKEDELVLLKPALNSPDPYPATTHPLSVKVLADEIRKKGGRVIIADQSGIGHVTHDEFGVTGSSKRSYEKSGMKIDDTTQFEALEERGWNEGFFNFKNKKSTSWPNGFYISNIIKEADHIVNLPRVSTHAQAGVTLGFKSLVGLLREDSRIEFHANGPYYQAIKKLANKTSLKTEYKSADFFDMMSEISLAIKNKLRLTLFVATKAQTTLGPDAKILSVFGLSILKSHMTEPNEGLVFASNDPVCAEATAIAFLKVLYKRTPLHHRLFEKILLYFNGQAKELSKEKVWQNPFVKRAIDVGVGKRDIAIEWENASQSLKTEIETELEL